MIYVTDHYNIIEFESEGQAIQYINEDIQKYGLTFEKVYDHTENNLRVIVYQYHTLYTQTYLIHHTLDLRN